MVKKIVLPIAALAVVAAGIVIFMARRPEAPVPITEDLAVPVYPSATTDTDTFSARLSPQDRAKLVKAVVYKTDDPPDKVIGFYKEKLSGDKTQVIETSQRGVPNAVFRTEAGGVPRIVIISSDEDTNKTEITISSIDPGK